jgi:hypothetical protein
MRVDANKSTREALDDLLCHDLVRKTSVIPASARRAAAPGKFEAAGAIHGE